MMKRFLLIPLMIVLVCGLIFGGCAKPAPAPAPAQPIKIGALVPLTGPYAMWGAMFMNAFELALDEVGWEVAGRPIEFIVEDEGGEDVTMALDKAKKLVESDRVGLVMGPFYGGSAYSVLPYTSSVPMINLKWSQPSSKPEELANKYAFWVPMTYNDCTYSVGLYAYDVMGIRTVTTIGSDYSCGYDFMEGFTDAIKVRGGKVLQQQWAPLVETDYSPYLSALKMGDALVLSTLGPVAKLVLFSQYKELGLFEKMPIILSEIGTLPPPIMQEMGDKIIGIIGPHNYVTTLDNPENRKFLPAYRAKYKEEPDDKTVGGYNGMRVVLAALEATGGNTDPETLKQALLKSELDLPTGHFKFCPGRIGIHDLHICEVQKVNDTLMWVPIKTYPAVEPYVKTYP